MDDIYRLMEPAPSEPVEAWWEAHGPVKTHRSGKECANNIRALAKEAT